MPDVKGRRAEYAELTRTAVLEAASTEFIERGFAATTVDQIAERARVSKGSVYHHFRDKAELFEAVFVQAQHSLIEAVATAFGVERQPWDRLEAGIDAYVEHCVSNRAHRRLLQQAPGALGSQRCREIDEGIGLPVLAALLKQLADDGELAVAPTDVLARVLFAALCEAAMTAGAADDPITARVEATATLIALFGGLQRRP